MNKFRQFVQLSYQGRQPVCRRLAAAARHGALTRPDSAFLRRIHRFDDGLARHLLRDRESAALQCLFTGEPDRGRARIDNRDPRACVALACWHRHITSTATRKAQLPADVVADKIKRASSYDLGNRPLALVPAQAGLSLIPPHGQMDSSEPSAWKS